MTATRRLRAIAALAATTALLATSCGGGSSSDSTPSYCTDRADLQQSVKGLARVDIINNGLSALERQLEKVRSDTKALTASAKKDFQSQTDAISTSVAALQASVKALPSSPSATQLGAVAVAVSNVGRAFKDFADATSSKC